MDVQSSEYRPLRFNSADSANLRFYYQANRSPRFSPPDISLWYKSLRIPKPIFGEGDGSPPTGESGSLNFSFFTSGLGRMLSPRSHGRNNSFGASASSTQQNFIEHFTRGLVDSSKNAVKAVQVKARHAVSQNKRRYQEGGFDLDMTYITENIIAMGFPAGDKSSGFLGYVEGFYRNHMEEVINFFETHHKGRYKVYNLCSERLYDASLFEGKVASFPFDDNECPPIRLIVSFCRSAYSWLKADIDNVVVVHCKSGMARTGLMVSSLLLYLKFFPTAEESIDYYNQKRCVDGKGLTLPSQIRYVKYFEHTLRSFNGETQPGRRCILKGVRLHKCTYWIRPSISVFDQNRLLFSTKKHPRTKDLLPDELWYSAPQNGIMVFSLPGEPGITELAGDFKILFHDGLGDFYCWLNTSMMDNRKVLNISDLDGFDKRKFPSPGFQVEVVLVDCECDTTNPSEPAVAQGSHNNGRSSDENILISETRDETDDLFSDDDVIETETSSSSSKTKQLKTALTFPSTSSRYGKTNSSQLLPEKTDNSGLSDIDTCAVSEFRAMAADTSVFTFGYEDDSETDD
ncbi:unnamed protein product [Rhodiola kirilowii]